MSTLSPESIVKTQTTQFAQFLKAYKECSEEIQTVIDEMTEILVAEDADETDRAMASATMVEALFPGLAFDLCDALFTDMQTRENRTLRKELDAEEECFAERLRERMAEKKISQEKLAELTGVGQPAISNILNRKSRPQRRTIERFALALNVKPEELWPFE